MISESRRREVGESDAPVEDAIDRSFHQIVDEGSQRLHRTWRVMLVTGTFGGLEIGVGVMAYLAILHETGSHLLGGVGFGIGFMALLLAKSELFTENFLVPITAALAGEARWAQLLKLYVATLVTNLISGWLFMWLVVLAFPQWAAVLTESAEHYVSAPIGVRSICLAVLGGSTITLMTRMQHGTTSEVAKILAGFAGGFLLAGLQLFHSILDSLLIFGAIHAGAPIGYVDWLRWFLYTVIFNVLGGLALVTSLRLVRTKELLREHREAVARDTE
jgi:formate/nitrite transporter FocA (FNT family)